MSNDLVTSDSGPAGDFSAGGGSFVQSRNREAEIRHVLATDRQRYFREGLDQELAEIQQNKTLADDPHQAASLPVVPLAPHRSRTQLEATSEGRELVAAWRLGPGGFDAALDATQRVAASIVQQVGDGRNQRAFMARFDREVSERARYHIYNEIHQPVPHAVYPATSADLNRFADTEAGAEMLKEWGNAAPLKVATVWARIERFRRALEDDDDFETFVDWYSDLQPKAVKAILRRIAQ